MWHDIREIPELNRSVLVYTGEPGFVLTSVTSNQQWPDFVDKGYSKWLYCDELLDRTNPDEFNVQFLRRLINDCEYAAKRLREYPSSRAAFSNTASSLALMWMTLVDVISIMKEDEHKGHLK
jgi:hypothetical protein